jgi:hypothetical protein
MDAARPHPVLVLAALIAAAAPALTGCSCLGGSSAASCVAPTVVVDPASARPGEEVTVSGEWFRECHDTRQNCEPVPPVEPLGRQEVVWSQGASEQALFAVEPDGQGRIHATLVVPADAEPGTASVVVGGWPAEVTVE